MAGVERFHECVGHFALFSDFINYDFLRRRAIYGRYDHLSRLGCHDRGFHFFLISYFANEGYFRFRSDHLGQGFFKRYAVLDVCLFYIRFLHAMILTQFSNVRPEGLEPSRP